MPGGIKDRDQVQQAAPFAELLELDRACWRQIKALDHAPADTGLGVIEQNGIGRHGDEAKDRKRQRGAGKGWRNAVEPPCVSPCAAAQAEAGRRRHLPAATSPPPVAVIAGLVASRKRPPQRP